MYRGQKRTEGKQEKKSVRLFFFRDNSAVVYAAVILAFGESVQGMIALLLNIAWVYWSVKTLIRCFSEQLY